MHFFPFSLFFILPLSIALQTIYLATDSSSGQQGTYIAFFSDSDPCASGTRFGFLPQGFNNCNQPLTILGHPNITFTGCKQPYTGYPGSLPTGVSDGGAPALKCKAAGNPPFAPGYKDGFGWMCNTGINGGFVNVIEYCS